MVIYQVIWNEELALKVVATAYTHLLKHLLKETQEGNIDAATWYTFLPDLNNTTGRWQQMAEKVWHNILQLPIISSEVSFEFVYTCYKRGKMKGRECVVFVVYFSFHLLSLTFVTPSSVPS